MRHRHYDPTLGRFLSRDPIGFAGGMNLYSYAGNSPAAVTDHTGLESDDPWGVNARAEAYRRVHQMREAGIDPLDFDQSNLGLRPTRDIASDALLLTAIVAIGTEAAAGAAFYRAVTLGRPLPAWVEAYYFGSGAAAASATAGASKRPCNQPRISDGLLEHTIRTPKGNVDFAAELVVQGENVLLQDIVVFSQSGGNLSGLSRYMFRGRTEISRFVASEYPQARVLQFQGIRVPTSSSANPGKIINQSVNLDRYRR